MQRKQDIHPADADASLADWYVRLQAQGANEADRASFAAWLAAADTRRRDAEALTRGLAALDDAATDADVYDSRIAAMIARGMAADEAEPEHTDTVVAFPRRALAWRAAMALAASLVLAIFGTAAWRQLASPTLTPVATAIGAVQEVKLADGSSVFVNTNSRIAYAITETRRMVRVESGEAYFQVAKDPSKPFVVSVGGHDITVTGTAFNVKYIDDHAELVVTEGTTRLSERTLIPGLGSDAAPVTAGMKATFAERRRATVAHIADAAAVGSWRTGTLIYRDKPLAEIIADLNRYLPSRLVLAEPARAGAAQRRFTVLLQVSAEDAMLDRVRLLLPVTLRKTGTSTYDVDLK